MPVSNSTALVPHAHPSRRGSIKKMYQNRTPTAVFFEDINPEFPLLLLPWWQGTEYAFGDEPEEICLKHAIELWSCCTQKGSEERNMYNKLCAMITDYQNVKEIQDYDIAVSYEGYIRIAFLQALILKTVYEVKNEWLWRADSTFAIAVGTAYQMGLHELEKEATSIRFRWNFPKYELEFEEARRAFWFLVHIDCWRCINYCRPRLISLDETIPDLPTSEMDFRRADHEHDARSRRKPNANITFHHVINTELTEEAFQALPGNKGGIEPQEVSFLAYQTAALYFLAKNQSGMTEDATQEAILRLEFFRARLSRKLNERDLANEIQARLTLVLICTSQAVLNKSIKDGDQKNHDLLRRSFDTLFKDVLCPDPLFKHYPWICYAYRIAMIWLLEHEFGDRSRLEHAECWKNEDDRHAFKKLIETIVWTLENVKYAANIISPAFSRICANPFLWDEAKSILPEAIAERLEKENLEPEQLGQGLGFNGSDILPDEITMFGQAEEGYPNTDSQSMLYPSQFFNAQMADYSGAHLQPGQGAPVMMSPPPYASNNLMNNLQGLQNGICGPAFSPQPISPYWPSNTMDNTLGAPGMQMASMPVYMAPGMPYSPPIFLQSQQSASPPNVSHSPNQASSQHVRILPRILPMPDQIPSPTQSEQSAPTSGSSGQAPSKPAAGQGRGRRR